MGSLLGAGRGARRRAETQASAISLASAAPSKTRLRAEFGECLRVRTASRPSSTNRWRIRATVATLVSSAFTMRLSLQPSPASETSALSSTRAFRIVAAGCLPLLIRSSSTDRSFLLRRTTYFLTVTSDMSRFPASVMMLPENQRTNSRSMTGGTSVNLLVLWDEYREVHPEGYAYSRFCQLFRKFERRLSPTMRQQHV